MVFYHYPYIFRTGKICGKLTSSVHNASDKHIGKYQSKENYHRKKQTKLREKKNSFPKFLEKNHLFQKFLNPNQKHFEGMIINMDLIKIFFA